MQVITLVPLATAHSHLLNMYLKLCNELSISSSLPCEPCLCPFDEDH